MRPSTSRRRPARVTTSTSSSTKIVTPGAPEWDGIGLLSFASADDYTERLFDDPAAEAAIFTDVAKFLELQRGETIPTSEFVYRDATVSS